MKEENLLETENATEELLDDGFEDHKRPIAAGRYGWLTWDNVHVGEELGHENREENYASYAFILSQADGGELIDSSLDGQHTDTICYPYAATFGDKALENGAFWSVKDQQGFTSPFALHERLASKIAKKEALDTMDYCISRYLESNDPYYFCLHYLTYGAQYMQAEFQRRHASLDAHAKTWLIGQFAIAEKVENKMIKGFTTKGFDPGMEPFEYFHHILTTHNELNNYAGKPLSSLKDLIDIEYFVDGIALHYLNYKHSKNGPEKYLQDFITRYVD